MQHRRVGLGTLLWSLVALSATAVPAPGVEAKYLPSDTELVISVNVKQMLGSEVAKNYRDAIGQLKGYLEDQIQNHPAAKYLERAGFDVFRDLHSVTVASNGAKDLDSIADLQLNPPTASNLTDRMPNLVSTRSTRRPDEVTSETAV